MHNILTQIKKHIQNKSINNEQKHRNNDTTTYRSTGNNKEGTNARHNTLHKKITKKLSKEITREITNERRRQ